MKKIATLFVAATLILSAESFAQKKTKKSAPDSSSFIINDDWEEKGDVAESSYGKKEMYKELNLSNDQKNKLKDVDKQNKEAMHAIKADSSLAKKMKREKFKAQKLAYSESVKRILTPTQCEKLQQLKELYKKDSSTKDEPKKEGDKKKKKSKGEEK
jgi:Spy/CpxP family protein refolding chaperone